MQTPTYYQEPSRLSFLLRHGWGRPLLVAGAVAIVGGYFWLSQGQVPTVATKEPYTQHIEKLTYPLKKEEGPVTTTDPRIEALLAQQRAQEATNVRLQQELDALRNRPLPKPEAQAPTGNKANGEKPRQPRHRDMGAMFFDLPADASKAEPLYTLAPGDTKVPCIVETKMNSDVESNATVKVTANIFDTKTRRRVLMPQGSTLLLRYHSKDLRYGNQRLPITSTLLTLPNGKTVELDQEPLMDDVGQAGLVSSIDNHFWRAVPAVVIQGVLRGSVQSVSGTNPYAAGMAGSAAQYGMKMTQPYIDMRPTILVEPGEACVAILTKAIELPEYKEKR